MFKISRAFLANTGYRMAWYDGLMLDFRDPESLAPTSTIYNLVNQGGKTTFLSLLFSCIRTKKDEFLQTITNPGQVFEDYFDPGGLPGIIAIEWTAVGAGGVPRSIVTGQLVVMNRQTNEADRWFFLISDTSKLAMEALPELNLTDRAASVQWLHQTRAALGEQAFFYTQTQSEWAKALTSTGLDVELIGRQVDFNKREGAMDESFLSFRDEREFLLRFLTLTMNAENSERVYQAISVHSKNIAGRKPMEASLGQLTRLQAQLAPFAEGAAAVNAVQRQQDEAESALSAAVATLDLRTRTATLRQQDAETQAREHAAAISASEAAQVAAAQGREVAIGEQLERARKDAGAAVEAAAEAVVALSTRRRECDAARTLLRQVGRKTELKELTAAIDALNSDIAPLRAAYATSAAQYSHALRTNRNGVLAQKQEAGTRVEKLKTAIDANKGTKRALQKQLDSATNDFQKAEVSLDTGRQRRQQLESAGAIQPGEDSARCVERWNEARAAATLARDNAETTQQTVETRMSEISERETQLRVGTEKVNASYSRAQSALKAAQAARAALCVHPVLCKAAEADAVDPDSDALPGLLERHQQEVQRDLTQAELAVGRLEEDARSLKDTGLSGRSLDVGQVVRFLAANGVKGARAYAEYISDVVPAEATARRLVESDPARFLGVVVPGADQLELARSLQGYPQLSRPVVVSVAATTPTRPSPDAELFVIGCRDTSLFNLAAASRFAHNVETEQLAQNNLRKQARLSHEAVFTAKAALQNYLAEHGPSKVAALQDEIAQAQATLEQFKIEGRGLAEEKAKHKETRDALKVELKALATVINNAEEQVRAAQDYVRTFESRVEALTAERARLAEQREQFRVQIEALDDVIERDEDARRSAALEMDTRDADAKRIATEMGTITGKDEAWKFDEAAAPLSVEGTRHVYKTASLALQAKETSEAAGLRERKATVEEDVTKLQAEYVRKAEGLSRPNIEALLVLDLDAIDQAAELATPEAEKLKERRVEERAVAQNNLDRWRSARQYPVYQDLALADLSTPDLALRVEDLDRAIASAQAARAQAEAGLQNFEQMVKNHKRAVKSYRDALGTLEDYKAGDALPREDMFLNADSAIKEATALQTAVRALEKQLKGLRDRAEKQFEAMQALVADPTFAQIESTLAEDLRRNTLSAALDDHERLALAIAQRMDSLRADLASMDADFDRALDSLMQLVDDSLSLLKRATQGTKLPENVPRVPGRSVLKISPKVFESTRETRRETLKPLVLALAAENRLPGSGPALATHAVMNLANDKLGLKLLKVVEDEQEQYVPVERMSKSGAESVTMAMLLYFVIAKLRSEEQSGGRANGGVLILDNPFSKATSRPVWEIIAGLSDAMGLQLILATGMNQYDTLSVFKRFIRVAKLSRNSVSGRTHLGFADFTLKSAPAQPVLTLEEAA